MINQLTKKQKLIILGILAFVALIVLLQVYLASQFKVASSDPSQNGRINTYNSVIITYSKAIDAENAKVTTTPDFAYDKQVEGTKLILSPKDALQNKVTYTVSVRNVCKTDDTAACVDYFLTFSTDNTIPFTRQSKEQQKRVVAQTDSQYQDSPILAILPVNETDFLIAAEPVKDFTYVVITPSVAATSLTEEEYNAAYAKYYQEGRKYLSDKGYKLESSKYKVVSAEDFRIIQESQTKPAQ